MDLPATISGRSVVADTSTVIVLPDGIVVDGGVARDASSALTGLPKDRQVVVMASRDIGYARVMEVLDTLRVSGHPRISLATSLWGR